MADFTEVEQIIEKFACEKCCLVKSTLNKENNTGGITLSDFKQNRMVKETNVREYRDGGRFRKQTMLTVVQAKMSSTRWREDEWALP